MGLQYLRIILLPYVDAALYRVVVVLSQLARSQLCCSVASWVHVTLSHGM